MIDKGGSVGLELIGDRSAETLEFDCTNVFQGGLLSTPLQLDMSVATENYQVHFLVKKSVNENEILPILDASQKKTRIGWCVPINALTSREHDLADDPHFLRYAYVAIRGLFSVDSTDFFTRTVDVKTMEVNETPQQFSDFLHPDTCLLVINLKALPGESFDVDRYMPSFIANGYIKLGHRNPEDLVWSVKAPEEKPKALVLHPISSDLTEVELIGSLLHNSVAYEAHPVFCFFYIYQVIELLMEHVFMAEHAAILDEYRHSVSELSTAKEVMEKLSRVTSEKKRLTLLITEYSRCQASLENLKQSSNEFLLREGRNGGSDFQAYFYGIRNYIFHQLRDLKEENLKQLELVVRDFVDFLPSLLSTYKTRQFASSGDNAAN
ncbi:hypothetical protein [Arthrobacter humicola]